MDIATENEEGLVDAAEDKPLSNDTSTSNPKTASRIKPEESKTEFYTVSTKSVPAEEKIETGEGGKWEGPNSEAVVATAMEIMKSTGTTSKLEQLLTAGTDRRSSRRGESAEPSLPNSTRVASPPITFGPPATLRELKVTPIRLKKYYPSAVQSAEYEEFLVSVSDDNSEEGRIVGKESSTNETKDEAVKSKLSQEHFGREGIDTAQIEKLLSMPSPKSWNKAARRQRRFMCKDCPKSYSSEDDLRSHSMNHSQVGDIKVFSCDYCEKQFKWVASLKVHVKKEHEAEAASSRNGSANENGIEGGDVKTASKTVDPQTSSDEADKSAEITLRKLEPPLLLPSDKAEPALTTTSLDAVPKIEDESKSLDNEEPDPVHSRRHRTIGRNLKVASGGRAIFESPTPRVRAPAGIIKKKYVRTAKANNKVKKVVSSTEVEPETPLTPSTGRTALRRTIQRPKWLTDTDLVTDYEFPRGTNSMRMGNAGSGNSTTTTTPSSHSTSSLTSSPSGSTKTGKSETRRSTSVDTTNEKQSTPAADTKKGKLVSRPSRENNRNEQSNVGARKSSSKMLKVGESVKGSKVRVSVKGATPTPPTNKSSPITRRKEKEQPSALPQSNSLAAISSPTQDLQNQILSLSLSTIAENSTGKNIRKRHSADATATSVNQSKKAEKRKRTSDSSTRSAESPSTSKSKKQKQDKKKSFPKKAKTSQSDVAERDGVVLKALKRASISTFKTVPWMNKDLEIPLPNCQGLYRNQQQLIPPIELDEGRIKEEPSCSIREDREFTSDTTNKAVNAGVVITEITRPDDQENVSVSLNVENSEAGDSQDTVEQGEIQSSVNTKLIRQTTTSSDPDPPANYGGTSVEDTDEKRDKKGELEALDKEGLSLSLKQEDGDERAQLGKGPVDASLPNASEHVSANRNDEGMPVLKPEATSSVVDSTGTEIVSCPDLNQLKRVDEEETNSSNHSANPYEAPVLSKESGLTAKNCVEAEDGMSGNSRVLVNNSNTDVPNVDDLDELPLIDDDEDNVIGPSRRDRSDSMSMRSCGSGTPSEKLKALDDTNTIASTKDKLDTNLLSDNECLVSDNDSDSNDTLMSEFSELAAQVTEKTDSAKFKEDCLRFMATKISANSMWSIRKELKRLKKDKNYFKFGKLSPLAAGLMHDIFCQSLR